MRVVIRMKEATINYGPADLLKAAAYFHGHNGPFLVLGLKAGDLSNRLLGREPFGTRVEIHSNPKPPQSCMVDGIQFSTGCTMGKGNISLHPGNGSVRAIFVNSKGTLELKLQPWVLESLKTMNDENLEATAQSMYEKPAESLFYFELKRL